ncbi:MAG: HAMP domain-containing histidine kinase [Spirochaetaceae bacterium]|nr:HAMP domain-containing histidine kinase [Spirochaetaceae bacterium]
MIELIKKRFIKVSMISSGIILFIILAIINILNYYNTTNRMDKMLSNQVTITADSNNQNRNNQPTGQKKSFMRNQRNKVFYVELDNNGDLIKYNKDNFSFLTVEHIIKLGSNALAKGEKKGFIEDYRYLVTSNTDNYQIAFIDAQSDLYTLQYNSIFSLIVYILGMFGILFLVKALTIPAVKPIEESFNKQKRFMTDIMHEIKTPLAIIETNTEVVEIDYGKNEWTKSIRKQIHYLKDLLDELVTLLKMEEHTTDLIKNRIDFSEILENTLTGFEPIFNKKGITMDIECDENVEINANEYSIERLVSILLENALKYTSGDNKVSIKLKKQNKKILFEIENSIKDIEPGDHEEFFDRFYRSDSSRNSNLGGHGIGLSIAKEIITQNKGKIKAFSNDNHSFTISILIN